MADHAFDVQSMLAHQLRPALVLDAHGIVIAANNGSRRLIALSQPAAPQDMRNPIIGQDISRLGLVVQRRPPALSSWSELLDAAVHVPRLDEPDHATTANSFHQDTDEFWDAEILRQAIVESNVCTIRTNDEHDDENEDNSTTVRARAIVHWHPRGHGGVFLLTFDRPPVSDRPPPSDTASEPSDGTEDVQRSLESSSDVYAGESPSNMAPTLQLGGQHLSGNEKAPLPINSFNNGCSLSMGIHMRSPMKGIIGRSTCLPEGDLSEHQEIYAENNFDSQTSHLTVVDNMTRISDPRSRCVNVDVESTLSSAQPPDEGKGATAGYPADHMSEHQSHRPAVFLFPTALPNPHAHILLVQHNAVNRKIMTKFAEKSGYQVTTVENGQEALDYLCRSSQRPRPKAVLMECSLFPMNGYATTRRIRHDHVMFDEETRNLPIIGLTIPAVHGHVDKCFDAGMDDYLLKPVKLRVFQSMLAKWTVARRSYKLGHIMDAKL